MQYIVAGLGNPGEEYEQTRHNVGRMVVTRVASMLGASDWRDDTTSRARMAQGTISGGDTVTLVLPDNYMNRSGGALAPLIKNAEQAERLVVVHDDIDLPLGTIRVVFNRGSGGHRGVDSIVRTLKTSGFIRVRVGVVPTTPTGKLRKPQGEEAVHNFILKQIPASEREHIATIVTRGAEAVLACVTEGVSVAMRDFNGVVGKKKEKTTISQRKKV